MPVCGYRLQRVAVGSFIDKSALHSGHHTTPSPPRRDSSGATRVMPLVGCSGPPTRDNPQTSCQGWSLPVRLRYTRNVGRAQQRNTNAATGSSVVSLRMHPEPNHRNAFCWRLSRVPVKGYRTGVSAKPWGFAKGRLRVQLGIHPVGQFQSLTE